MVGILGGDSRDKLGYIRLKGEVESYRIELRRAAERVERAEGEPPWLDEAQALLDMAEEALGDYRIEEGWSHLNTARRVELDSLLGDDRGLAVQARIALAEASSLPDPWIREIVPTIVNDAHLEAREDDGLSVTEVRAARYILDRQYQQTFLRRRYAREQFSGLTLLGIVSITLFALLTVVGGFLFGEAASPFGPGASERSWFLLYVLLAGTIGASLFGIVSSIRTDPRVATLPQTISSDWMVAARVLTGAISAFVLFLFVRTNIVSIGGENPEAAVLLISLVAGYSERLAPRALAAVSDRIASGFERTERETRPALPRGTTPVGSGARTESAGSGIRHEPPATPGDGGTGTEPDRATGAADAPNEPERGSTPSTPN